MCSPHCRRECKVGLSIKVLQQSRLRNLRRPQDVDPSLRRFFVHKTFFIPNVNSLPDGWQWCIIDDDVYWLCFSSKMSPLFLIDDHYIFSRPEQGSIDFKTVNLSLPGGMDFLIHPCRRIDDEENVRTPPILERNWKIHPLRPQDFPRPSFWWSTDTLLMITLIWEKYTWNVGRG